MRLNSVDNIPQKLATVRNSHLILINNKLEDSTLILEDDSNKVKIFNVIFTNFLFALLIVCVSLKHLFAKTNENFDLLIFFHEYHFDALTTEIEVESVGRFGVL
jgi:hypothetical protein